MNNPYVKLAKSAIETFVKTAKISPLPDKLPKKMLIERAGVFVTIHRRDASLRGCIGTFLPTKENIAQEIVANAISSAVRDPRFPPVTEDELSDLVYSVDILSASKTVSNRKAIDPKKYGLIVSAADGRRGLLLPDIPGVETAEEQIAICKRKASIMPSEKVKLQIFTVERHGKK